MSIQDTIKESSTRSVQQAITLALDHCLRSFEEKKGMMMQVVKSENLDLDASLDFYHEIVIAFIVQSKNTLK